MSAQPCGCDIEEKNYICEQHRSEITSLHDPYLLDASVLTASVSGLKDSGSRQIFSSGMQRDTEEGKTDYTLCLDGPMFERWNEQLRKGGIKYTKRNWMQATGEAELARFRASAMRHFMQWMRGDIDEDHAAAVFFNINGAEYVKEKMRSYAVGLVDGVTIDRVSGIESPAMEQSSTVSQQIERRLRSSQSLAEYLLGTQKATQAENTQLLSDAEWHGIPGHWPDEEIHPANSSGPERPQEFLQPALRTGDGKQQLQATGGLARSVWNGLSQNGG